MFWVRIDTLADRDAVDFTLLREPDRGRRHRFAALGDPQVRNLREVSQLDSLLASLKEDLDRMPAAGTVPVLVAGDVVFNRPKMHGPSKRSFAALGQPVFYAIGNHDHDLTVNDDDASAANYRRHFGFWAKDRRERLSLTDRIARKVRNSGAAPA